MKTYKLLLFSDLHITNRNPRFKRDKNGISDLLTAQLDLVELVATTAAAEDCDAILFLGDWTDYPTLDPVTLTYSNRMVQMLVETGIPLYMLEGNHCMDDDGALFTVLGASGWLVSGKKKYFITHTDKIIHDGDLVFHIFPYQSDYRKLEQEIIDANESLDSSKLNIMLFHFPTVNALLDNGLESFNGVQLSSEKITNFDAVLGGDFHKPQVLSHSDGKARYIGAPFDLKFNQQGPRVFSILEISKDSYVYRNIMNPYNYTIKSMTSDEALVLDGDTAAKMIVRITDPVDTEMKEHLKNIGFYKLSFVNQRETNRKDLEKVVMVDSLADDKTIFQQELAKLDIEKDIKKRAFSIYTNISKKGG